jgi:hypothetical protein
MGNRFCQRDVDDGAEDGDRKMSSLPGFILPCELKDEVDMNNWFAQNALPRPTRTKAECAPGSTWKWKMWIDQSDFLKINPPMAVVYGPNSKVLKKELTELLISRINSGKIRIVDGRPQFDPKELWPGTNAPRMCTMMPGWGEVLKICRLSTACDEGQTLHNALSDMVERNRDGRIGVDIEREPKTNITTLIQISDASIVLLFRTNRHIRPLPNALAIFFQNPKITKLFVDPANDIKFLFRDFNVSCAGVVDIQKLAVDYGFVKASTEVLAKYFLRYNLVKDKTTKMQYTMASLERPLGEDHVKYAALDAIVAYEIGKKMDAIDSSGARNIWTRQLVLWQ